MAIANVVRDEWLYIIRTDRQGGKCSVECQNADWEDRKFAQALAKAIEAWTALRLEAETKSPPVRRGHGLVREAPGAVPETAQETRGREGAPAAPPEPPPGENAATEEK